jgi:tetratricopeptide (TPR) repeat protein
MKNRLAALVGTQHLPLLLVLLVFLGLGIGRMNDLSLYTDCTRYLVWGNSVAHGKGFVDDTQPVPEHYIVNAPFYAVVVAPILVFFPMSLIAAKMWTLMWGAIALILFYRWVSRHLGPSIALAGSFFLAVNPLMLVISTEVLSEATFMAIIYGSFLFLDRIEDTEISTTRQRIFLIVVFAVVMVLREVGVALVIAFALHFVRRKKYLNASLVVLSAFIIFGLWTYRNSVLVGIPANSQQPNLKFFFGHFVTSPDASLFNEVWLRVWINLKGYYAESGGLIFHLFPLNLLVAPGGLVLAVSKILLGVKSILAVLIAIGVAVGIVLDLRSTKTGLVRLLFLALYLGVILLYPVHDIRFQLPIIPLLLFYILRVFKWLGDLWTEKGFPAKSAVGVAILILFTFPNLVCAYELLKTNLLYRSTPTTFWQMHRAESSSASYFSTPWSVMGELIAKSVPPASVIACSDKEVVPYAANYKFLEVNRGVPLPQLEAILRTNDVQYLIGAKSYGDVETFQVTFFGSRRFRLEPIDSVAGLTLYRIRERLLDPVSTETSTTFTLQMDRASGLMRLGRLSLQAERYEDALKIFSAARNRYPQQSEITFYILVTRSLKGDSLEAVQELQRLYESPSATAFIPPARVFLYAMNEVRRARTLKDDRAHSLRLYGVSTIVWNLGYSAQAYDLLKEMLARDMNHFVGLLWGWHWGMQVGDTVGVVKYLKRLQEIDSGNAVVRSFTAMNRLQGLLKKTSSGTEESRLHLLLSGEYDKIDLPEEALDEAEKAIRADSSSSIALKAREDLLRKRRLPPSTGDPR